VFAARFSGSGLRKDSESPFVDAPDVMGKVAQEEGMESLSMDELNFGGNDAMLQGDLADCMEEIGYTLCLAREKSWDRNKIIGSFFEIAECYQDVFSSKLGLQLREHICAELAEKFAWELSVAELEAMLTKRLGIGISGKLAAGAAAVLAFGAQVAIAQDGNQGIAEATNKVAGYFDTGTDLMYAIGAIMGLVGAVKVYSKWNAGEPDTAKVATAWFGSCIFLVVVATVLKSFFGI